MKSNNQDAKKYLHFFITLVPPANAGVLTITWHKTLVPFFVIFFFFQLQSTQCLSAGVSDSALNVIPYPQQVIFENDEFDFQNRLNIVLYKSHSAGDEFTANELIRDLKNELKIDAVRSNNKESYSIVLQRKKISSQAGRQGYQLSVNKNGVVISAPSEEGLFYGTQTLLQLIEKNESGYKIRGLKIIDWPDIPERVVHYDTKHHQDKFSYVKTFIKDLSRYKINILLWEWEDKFAYPSHPEIGAPGAFTPAEIQELTDYARQYHIQIAPLVQGLGHSSFILKWPQFAHLREIPASNFEFCPLKSGSYDLLFDLWKDAMDATKGSQYIHIGSDETYELGECEQCRKKAKTIGKKGLYHLFSDKAANFVLSKGRTPMIWEMPMGWKYQTGLPPVQPNKGLVLTEDDTHRDKLLENAREAKDLGYKIFFYDPNPGIEPLFLPYYYRAEEDVTGGLSCLQDSYNLLTKAANSGIYDGMVRTSWGDAGLHNQIWMLSFATAAEYSWNGRSPGLDSFTKTFFKDYYGDQASNMDELFRLLNEGGYYYWDTFERKVWHWGEIGKTYLPDLPRGDAVEYDPYWNTLHGDMVKKSKIELGQINRALDIIKVNEEAGVKHPYDFELFETIAQLIRHTCIAYEDLSLVEQSIKAANRLTFIDRDSTYFYLDKAAQIVDGCIRQRTEVFNNLTSVWEKTRLPKGMSTDEKKYFFQQDRTRHFANRRPDMTYLIYDEQKLNMEGWLEKLRSYMEKYKNNSFQ